MIETAKSGKEIVYMYGAIIMNSTGSDTQDTFLADMPIKGGLVVVC